MTYRNTVIISVITFLVWVFVVSATPLFIEQVVGYELTDYDLLWVTTSEMLLTLAVQIYFIRRMK